MATSSFFSIGGTPDIDPNDFNVLKETLVTQAAQATTSATSASTSATNAATSETNASASATLASSSASNAATSATNAASSASAASTSATNAASSASSASSSQTAAATSATNAASSASAASTSATNAATSATNAANSATQAANTLASKADQSALTAHTGDLNNPHVVTKSQVGLGNVDNTSDVNKPVSTAQQTALNLKADTSALTAHTGNTANPHGVTKAQVGLGNVDNTSDASKPVSTAQQTALNLKADLSGAIFTGNIGVGVTPSAWTASQKTIQMGHSSAVSAHATTPYTYLSSNWYADSSNVDRYLTANSAGIYRINGNVHTWFIAPTGTAGAAATFTAAMTLDANGNLLVGDTSGSEHRITKACAAEGNIAVYIGDRNGVRVGIYRADGGAYSGAACAITVPKNLTTSRSINAAGTINASGADYAEYMRKAENCGQIAKGAIVGVNAQGLLTDKWAESVSFLIKSTDPSYVGGDTWGSEEALGMSRPVEPIRKADVTEQRLVAEAIPEVRDEEGNIVVEAKEAQYETVILEAGDTGDEWQAKQDAYQAELAKFEAKLEEARHWVDRIAFAGQVPVNVYGATVGDYIVPTQDGEGIKGLPVAEDDMTLKQYMKAVGIVQNILPDGRANVRVKVA